LFFLCEGFLWLKENAITFFIAIINNRKVIGQFLGSDSRFKDIFPFFDLKKNIYTARRIPGLDSKVGYLIGIIRITCIIVFY
jgi:hypothetical protein